MSSPALLSKDIDFPQAQEVGRGNRSDRTSQRRAASETAVSLSDGISRRLKWRKLCDLHICQTDICYLPFLTLCRSGKSPITSINHSRSSLPCRYSSAINIQVGVLH
ncbi:hypothetical protein AMECASPLE_022356 [Ameca splendens]|uniref:Uncharacterized protein n=1 Tax=Ameca splendens TaxID=208324 RepID=A0ABV1AB09_9TELE